MKYNLEEFRTALGRIRDNRQDIVSEGYKAVALPEGTDIGIQIAGHGEFPLTHYAHTQLAAYAEIPVVYYDRLLAASPPTLLNNLDLFIPDRSLLFRIVDDTIIAILSNMYMVLDNDTVFEGVLKDLTDSYHDLNVHQCYLTDSRMYAIFLEPSFTFTMNNADVVPGVIIRNSEIGDSAFRADMYLHIKDADVGLIGDNQAYRMHRGRQHNPGPLDITESMTDEEITKQRDMIMGNAYDPKPFARWIMQMRANGGKILEKPFDIVTRVAAEHDIQNYSTAILNTLVNSGEATKWSLAIAIATTAKNEFADKRFRLERIAGMVASEPLQTKQMKLEEK